MKKTMILIAAFAILFTSVSAAVDERRVASFGKESPAVVVENNGMKSSLESFRGKWVVLSFWSSTDAQSRLTQNKIASLAKSADASLSNGERSNDDEIEFRTPAGVFHLGASTQTEVLSVNLDSSASMMNEIIKLDNLPPTARARINSENEAMRLREAFEMVDGLRTFIIDPAGRLVMADPSDEALSKLLAKC